MGVLVAAHTLHVSEGAPRAETEWTEQTRAQINEAEPVAAAIGAEANSVRLRGRLAAKKRKRSAKMNADYL